MIKRILIVSTFMIICLLGRAGNDSEKYSNESNASPAVRNSLKFNYDLIDKNNIDELTDLSDDFNIPMLRSHWNSCSDQNEWTLKERPGFLRIKAQKKTTVEDIHPEETFSQKIKLNTSGEAVSLIDLTKMTDNTLAGLYYSSTVINYIGIELKNGNKNLIVRVGNDIYNGPVLNTNTILLRVKIDVSKAWFEYSFDGIEYSKLGCEFKLNVIDGDKNIIGLYCLNSTDVSSSVDIDWFYFNPKVDNTYHFAETENKNLIPEI
jgi:beta-xylosidase